MYSKLIFSNEWKKAKIYNKYLGVKFGENVRITSFPRFGSEPYLISVGNNVTITRGVSFVNHDGGVAIFRSEFPGLNVYDKITIGNNVFIGINTIILKGVEIGDNVVIGAGSIINKNIPSNSVFAGVPAKYIKSIDEYKSNSLQNAFYTKDMTASEKKEYIINKLNSKINQIN